MDEIGCVNGNTSTPSTPSRAEQALPAVLEPYVTADEIASFIGETRRNVLRMARQGKLTCYLLSGSERHTYKFKRSEVSSDLQQLRRPRGVVPKDIPKARLPKP